MAPVNHVFADGVGPVHVAPDGRVGIVLIKHVVGVVPENWGVGIVHPIFWREQVELRAEWIGGELGLQIVARNWPGSTREDCECAGSCRGAEKVSARGSPFFLSEKNRNKTHATKRAWGTLRLTSHCERQN